MISRSCSSTDSVRRRSCRPLDAPLFMSHCLIPSPRNVCNTAGSRAASSVWPDTIRSGCRSRGVLLNRPPITRSNRRTSTASARLVSCVTGPVFSGPLTQPRHPITGPLTQLKTGRLTQPGGVGGWKLWLANAVFSRTHFSLQTVEINKLYPQNGDRNRRACGLFFLQR